MFRQARLKLTAWYVLILMAVTLTLSSIFYAGVMRSTKQALLQHNRRVELRLREVRDIPQPLAKFQDVINQEAMQAVRISTLTLLGTINLIILAFASSLSYLLAGVTLQPIQAMVEKQKQFVADASHELKTPLTAIKTNLEVNLRNKTLSIDQVKAILADTVKDIDALTSLTNTLLKESRYNSSVKTEIVNLKQLTETVVKKYKVLAKEHNIKLETDVQDITAKADKASVEELIAILIDNAIKFNKENGKVQIRVFMENKNAVIEVSDTGIGIDEKSLPYIFDRFFKADTARTKQNHDGFGLGLSIAKEIVEINKGSIEVTSKLGESTTFTVKLPADSKQPLSKLQ